ncbi:ArsR family transcriptional regulator [Paenibacillus sp. FSL K6-3182]|uniref:ArsR/SmtB family transcription factor n=1 Tax=Paenibacillus sp. FSL K6-3182 TaxID=2921495 RepID=UPI0030D61CD2
MEALIILDWKIAAKRLHFSYHEPIEFLVTMKFVAQFEHMKAFAREIHFTLDDEMIRMAETANASMSNYVKAEIAALFGDNMFKERLDYVMVMLFVEERDKLNSSEDFLAFYRDKPASELVFHLAAAKYNDENMEWTKGRDWGAISKDAELLYELVAGCELPDQAEHAALLEHIRFSAEYKQRTLFIMEQFHRYAYMPMRDRLKELGEAGAVKYRALFDEQPERAIRDITKMDVDLVDKETAVHVSYFSQVRVGIHRDDREGHSNLVVIGINNDAFAWRNEDQETIERFLKVIADRRRLELIELLRHKNYYGNELAQEMGLTPAAISYHTNMLFDLNLIQLIRVDNRIYYELDKEKIAYYWEQTRRKLLP